MKRITMIGVLGWVFAVGCGNANKVADGRLETGWYHVVDSGVGVERKLGDSLSLFLDPEPVVSVANFETITTESFPHDSSLWEVVVHLDADGGKRFSEASGKLIGQDLTFVLDDSIQISPIRIRAQISSGVTAISKPQFSKAEAVELGAKIIASKER